MSKSDQQLTEAEEAELIAYENELANARKQNMSQASPYSAAMFSGQQKQNLIEWELDFKPELESVERLMRCDVLIPDKDNKLQWAANPNKELVLFNDTGVNDVIRYIVILVNKNKALSNYDDVEINDRVRQIKHEIRTLIYNNYEAYGFDNDYKINNYSMVVMSIGSIVEDVYRRAMNGETHRGLAEQRSVLQTDPLIPQGMQGYPGMTPQKQVSGLRKLMPWNWKG